MPLETIQHAIGLHLHQPADTLPKLLRQDEGNLRRVLLCYERLARHAHKYAHVARLHVALSGVLLEQLRDPAFIEASRHLADVPAILDSLRSAPNIEFIGTGYRHAPLPLIPPEDWEEQLRNERVVVESVLGRVLKGYFPPAAQFTLELIPALVRAGYEYVLLPGSALVMPDGHGADPYRVYRLRYGDVSIDVVPWDRGFSHVQESGLDVAWFADEVRNGVAQSPASNAPYLLTTWSVGDAGEWFRTLDEEHGFFGHFFSPYMEFCETGEFPVRPTDLAEYLRRHPASMEVELGPQMQAQPLGADAQAARERLFGVVARYWSAVKAGGQVSGPSRAALLEVRELTLRAEESDYLLGGISRREEMLSLLDRAAVLLAPKPALPERAAPAERPHQHGKSAVAESDEGLAGRSIETPQAGSGHATGSRSATPPKPAAESPVKPKPGESRAGGVTPAAPPEPPPSAKAKKPMPAPAGKKAQPEPERKLGKSATPKSVERLAGQPKEARPARSLDATARRSATLPKTEAEPLLAPKVDDSSSSRPDAKPTRPQRRKTLGHAPAAAGTNAENNAKFAGEGDTASLRDVQVKAVEMTPPAPPVPSPAGKGATAKTGKTVQSRPPKKESHKK